MVINYEVLNNLLVFILKFFYLYYYMKYFVSLGGSGRF